MSTLTIPLDKSVEDTLFAGLQANGLVCLPNAVEANFLAQCRDHIDGLLDERGHRHFSIIQAHQVEDGPFADMVATPRFVDMLRSLARRLHSDEAVKDFELYNVLRVIAGDDAAKTAFEFHYDATVLTMLMPIIIPDGPPGKAGELVARPNHRPYRSSAVINIVEKVLVQNPLAFRYYGRRYGSGESHVVQLEAGNLYFFNGYRTFHGNLPCLAGQKRATLIFHFGDPHVGDPLSRLVLRIRRMREERRLRVA